MKTLCLVLSLMLSLHAKGQAYGTSIAAGIGTPAANSMPCNATVASTNLTSLYDQRDLTTGNSVWKCKLAPDNVTYSWVAPFIAPFMGTGTTAAITPPTLVGCTSGTVTIPGATTSMAATVAPIGSPGTGQINSTGSIGAGGVVTVTLCLPITLTYTATAVPYKVLVF